MQILIAPNAFKNSLTAREAADAIRKGLEQSAQHTSVAFPIADGGDGTGTLIIERMEGTTVSKEVHDPLGRKITATFGLIDGGRTAVVEMADASGMKLLRHTELSPLNASSAGTGELLKFALDQEVSRIILAMGGSATVDGGCGILHALGIRFRDAGRKPLSPVPAELINLATIDDSGLDPRILACELIVLCDVDNNLLGANGAAETFGPQKGASPQDVQTLENFLHRLNEIAGRKYGKSLSGIKHGGTAGGAAAGLFACLNAQLVPGAEYYLNLTGFASELQKSQLVITGEGSIDEQTLRGKGPYCVAKMAKSMQIPVIALAGSVPLVANKELSDFFEVILAIGNTPEDLAGALGHTQKNLSRAATAIGNLLTLSRNLNGSRGKMNKY